MITLTLLGSPFLIRTISGVRSRRLTQTGFTLIWLLHNVLGNNSLYSMLTLFTLYTLYSSIMQVRL